MGEQKHYNNFYLILYITWASVYSLVSLYMNEIVGLNLAQIGLLMSVLPLISLVFQPIWGAISDGLGKRKRVLQGLLLMNAIIAILITRATDSLIIVMLYCIYTLYLCGQGPLTDSLSISFVNDNDDTSFGNIRVWGSIGYAFGAFGVAIVANQFGLEWIFYIAAIGYIASIFLANNLNSADVDKNATHYKRDIKALMKENRYLIVLIYSFLVIGSFFGADQYLGLYIRSKGVSVSYLGFLTFLSVCVEVPLIFNSRRLIKRFGAIELLIAMNIVSITRMVLLAFSSSIGMFVVAGIFRGFIVGIFIPVFIELICEITPKHIITSGVSIYSAVSSGIATFVFTLCGGIIAERMGYESLYFIYAFVTLVPLVFLLKYKKIWLHSVE